ncbi:hypothetical protein RND71_020379 [Anisodus tanguticus]|uniref:Uncharacterized protein n=1 Tax=Anisodus tanguticus TaxID=243964 RepID=A0AAE1S2E1_9SOLA|nr:hypothetical protein RND71_020379 [Anisodus tanguticus]
MAKSLASFCCIIVFVSLILVDENVGRVEGKTCYKVVNEIICKNDDPEPHCLPACKHLVGGGSGATCAPQPVGPSICACVYQC